MFSTILGAIAAIPELIKAIRSLISYFEKMEKERWFAQKTDAFRKLDEAKTDEEYAAAAKAIHETIKNL